MSKSTPDGWNTMPDQPRTCAGCNVKLVLSRDTIWLDTMRKLSWHMECRPQNGESR